MRHVHLTVLVLLAAAFLVATAGADDGILFRRDVSKTPDLETEHATLKMLKLYVPAQTSSGELVTLEYLDASGALYETRAYAKPLVAAYQDGEVEHVPDVGFSGHGHRDAHAALSLDDGASWKRVNLSRSGDLSSFTLRDGTRYPGDVVRIATAAAGNQVLVAWASRYCRGGTPAYTLEDEEKAVLRDFLGEDEYSLYLDDVFGIAGSQRSSDFADEGYPEVGEVPYSCLWTARGTLELNDESGLHEVVWRKPERLTSGRRDVNRIEATAVTGVGFIVTWQEDPDGLRPGQGEGPGEGWSGAIAHHETDIWFSRISSEHFGLVRGEDGVPIPLDVYGALVVFADGFESGDLNAWASLSPDGVAAPDDKPPAPKIGVPMAMPLRLTDNAKCDPLPDADEVTYCNFEVATLYGLPDFCADTLDVLVGPDDTVPSRLCVTGDGRVLIGNIASTRARVNLRPYTKADGTKSAWVIVAYEESKGLGDFLFDSSGNPCEVEGDDCAVVDEGKNVWYHSFDIFEPEVVSHGNILNQPAVDPLTGTFYDLIDTTDLWDFGAYNFEFYETEIARRYSQISQAAAKAGDSGAVLFAMYKQGMIKQGGPADIFARRFVLPDGFDPTVDNPYAYENMVCGEWALADGTHPYYPGGICLDPAINLSAVDPTVCEGGDCPPVTGDSATGVDPAEPGDFVDVLVWEQTVENLGDLSWTNPFDVAKGHRGFIDGDFIMAMYAWSPNWKKNAVGHDHNNLYIRRSFDGGQSWTTLPASFTHVDGSTWSGDGTTTCENYHDTSVGVDGQVCTTYGPGEFEQARNISQLVSMKWTILDPRFTPTPASIVDPDLSVDDGFDYELYPDDIKNPSRFYATYETGDNTTVAEGEATPLDMYYSRAYEWGDEYELIDVDGDGIGDEFDWLENKKTDHASEAAVTCNPGGTYFYAIWNQWREDAHENIYDSDAIFRRVMYIEE